VTGAGACAATSTLEKSAKNDAASSKKFRFWFHSPSLLNLLESTTAYVSMRLQIFLAEQHIPLLVM
jgi:hypothetical protein